MISWLHLSTNTTVTLSSAKVRNVCYRKPLCEVSAGAKPNGSWTILRSVTRQVIEYVVIMSFFESESDF